MTQASAPLTMIQLMPDVQRATAWMLRQPRHIVRPGRDDGYGWHAILKAAFGDTAPKPFRLIERRGQPVQLLAYTTLRADALQDSARLNAEPAVYAALHLDELSAKPMPVTFRSGQRLGFDVRVRPTVRQDRDGNRDKSREKDAFLAAIERLPPRGERDDVSREEIYRKWFGDRLKEAATLETFGIASMRRTLLLRPEQIAAGNPNRNLHTVGLLQRGVKGEQGGSPEATFRGELSVTDPGRFLEMLTAGVGRHRAFGFGMLLLRPPKGS